MSFIHRHYCCHSSAAAAAAEEEEVATAAIWETFSLQAEFKKPNRSCKALCVWIFFLGGSSSVCLMILGLVCSLEEVCILSFSEEEEEEEEAAAAIWERVFPARRELKDQQQQQQQKLQNTCVALIPPWRRAQLWKPGFHPRPSSHQDSRLAPKALDLPGSSLCLCLKIVRVSTSRRECGCLWKFWEQSGS